MTQYSSSVDIRPEWAVIEQIQFASLIKLSCNVGEPQVGLTPRSFLECTGLERVG